MIDAGDAKGADELFPLVYDELRKLASRELANERPGHSFNSTGLVHEAYLRLVGGQQFVNNKHFFGAAAQAMRRILIDSARRKGRAKRGGDRRREHPDLDALHAIVDDERLIVLNEALEQFAKQDPVKAKLVELRFFAGLTLAQAADCLGISLSTADRAWSYARAWLYEAMSDESRS